MKIYIKMEKSIYKIWCYWNEKIMFHQHERRVSINNIDNNKKVLSTAKFLLVKKGFGYFVGFKDV